MNKNIKDRTGQRRGMLTFISLSDKMMLGNRDKFWNAICDCGTEVVTRGAGYVQSCGCYNVICRQTHKQTGTPTHVSWLRMRNRCNNPSASDYHRYGGRMVKVCDRWGVFENFREDMGDRPSLKHSIDRIDNDGDYEPSNCRWATMSEQARNRRSTSYLVIDGICKCLPDWAGQYDIDLERVRSRLKAGWSSQKALATPVRAKR